MRRLAAAPAREAVALLRERLLEAPAALAARLERLVKDLDDDDFAVRERATAELARLGRGAEARLRALLAGRPSAEARRRAEGLLRRLPGPKGPALAPDELAALRGVEVLERLGAPEARQALEALAGGAAEARLTREAQAALRRLPR
jgi:hypothetical protein